VEVAEPQAKSCVLGVFLKSALIVGQFKFIYIVCKSCGTYSHRFVTHSSGFSLGQVLRKNLSLLRDIRLTVYLI
jgi:predicted nucleic-acid-binding Zn-ribbon protein